METEDSAPFASRGPVDATVRPVFVGGCERSGTTMLASVLAAADDVVAIPESQFLVESLQDPAVRSAIERGAAGQVLTERLVRHWRFLAWELDLSTEERSVLAATRSVGEFMRTLARTWAERRTGTNGAFRALVDHTPWNLRYAGRIAEAIPEARFVHIVRDGRAVAASVLPLRWGPNDALAAGHWWVEKVALALISEKTFGADRVVRVRYEDVIRDPGGTVHEIRRFLGLDEDDRGATTEATTATTATTAASRVGFAVPAYTRDQHRKVSHAPDSSRIDAWREDLGESDVQAFESVAETLLTHLGYECVHEGRSFIPSGMEQFQRGVNDFLHFYLINPPRNRLRRLFVRAKAACSRAR